jgi:hypothetical protein
MVRIVRRGAARLEEVLAQEGTGVERDLRGDGEEGLIISGHGAVPRSVGVSGNLPGIHQIAPRSVIQIVGAGSRLGGAQQSNLSGIHQFAPGREIGMRILDQCPSLRVAYAAAAHAGMEAALQA